MAAPPPPGIYVPVPTFFQHHPSSLPTLNPRAQALHTLHLARSGIKGLVLAGSTGEAVHLTRAERKSLIAATREVLTKGGYTSDYPLIAGVASDCVADAVEQLRDAREAGAQFGMVLVPCYFAGAGRNRGYQEGIREWFARVADESPIPILIYHYPAVSNNVTVDVATYESLASHANIVGCKLSHGNVSVHLQLAALAQTHSFHVFSGLGQQLFPILCGGCHGAIDGLAGIFPKTMVHLFDTAWEFVYGAGGVGAGGRQEKLRELRALQVLVSRAEGFVEAEGTVGIKFAVATEVLAMAGGEEGIVQGWGGGRPPLQGGMREEEYKVWVERGLGRMRELEAGL